MKRKLLSFAMGFVAVLMLVTTPVWMAGCGKKNDTPDNGGNPTPDATVMTLDQAKTLVSEVYSNLSDTGNNSISRAGFDLWNEYNKKTIDVEGYKADTCAAFSYVAGQLNDFLNTYKLKNNIYYYDTIRPEYYYFELGVNTVTGYARVDNFEGDNDYSPMLYKFTITNHPAAGQVWSLEYCFSHAYLENSTSDITQGQMYMSVTLLNNGEYLFQISSVIKSGLKTNLSDMKVSLAQIYYIDSANNDYAYLFYDDNTRDNYLFDDIYGTADALPKLTVALTFDEATTVSDKFSAIIESEQDSSVYATMVKSGTQLVDPKFPGSFYVI